MPVKTKKATGKKTVGKTIAKKSRTSASKKNNSTDCRVTTTCSKAGRDLALLNLSSAGKKLNKPCKPLKAKRLASGCLSGTKTKKRAATKDYVEVMVRIPKSQLK